MNTIIETERLLLRHFVPEDAEELYALNQDWEVLKYTGDRAFKDAEEARDFLLMYQINTYDKFGYGRMITLLKDTHDILGWCGLKYHPDSGQVDLGFRFHQRYWNKGYATEASLACLQFANEKLKLDRVIANAINDNLSSIRVLEKLGFQLKEEKLEQGKVWKVFEIELPL